MTNMSYDNDIQLSKQELDKLKKNWTEKSLTKYLRKNNLENIKRLKAFLLLLQLKNRLTQKEWLNYESLLKNPSVDNLKITEIFKELVYLDSQKKTCITNVNRVNFKDIFLLHKPEEKNYKEECMRYCKRKELNKIFESIFCYTIFEDINFMKKIVQCYAKYTFFFRWKFPKFIWFCVRTLLENPLTYWNFYDREIMERNLQILFPHNFIEDKTDSFLEFLKNINKNINNLNLEKLQTILLFMLEMFLMTGTLVDLFIKDNEEKKILDTNEEETIKRMIDERDQFWKVIQGIRGFRVNLPEGKKVKRNQAGNSDIDINLDNQENFMINDIFRKNWLHPGRDMCYTKPNSRVSKYIDNIGLKRCGVSGSSNKIIWSIFTINPTTFNITDLRLFIIGVCLGMVLDGGHSIQEILVVSDFIYLYYRDKSTEDTRIKDLFGRLFEEITVWDNYDFIIEEFGDEEEKVSFKKLGIDQNTEEIEKWFIHKTLKFKKPNIYRDYRQNYMKFLFFENGSELDRFMENIFESTTKHIESYLKQYCGCFLK